MVFYMILQAVRKMIINYAQKQIISSILTFTGN